jgi:quercetin dioxygenase-like cupin family protein
MRKALVLAMILLAGSPALAEAPSKITPLAAKEFANIPGKEGLMLTVDFAPGEVSAAHRHNAHVFVYVVEGSVVMQVKGGEEATLKKGDTFYENPSDIHSVAKNASATEPAKILVFMVKDKDAPPVLPAE